MIFTNEQECFIRENYFSNTLEQLGWLLFQKYGITLSKDSLKKHCQKLGLKKGQGAPGIPKKSRRLDKQKEQNQWLIENYQNFDFSVLCDLFRFAFNENICDFSIYRRLYKNGIRLQGLQGKILEEEMDFIKNSCGMSNREVALEYKEKYKKNISVSAVTQARRKLGVVGKPNFPKELGSEMNKNSLTIVKVANSKKYSERWVPKARLIYEQHYGKVPDGSRVIFLDGNTENFDISNLYCVSHEVMSVLAGLKWYGKNNSNMETKIKYAELRCALKNGGFINGKGKEAYTV